MLNHEIWQTVLAELELTVSRPNFITWFKNTGIIANQQGQVILCVPNAFTRAWLGKKYHQTIIQSLERVTGKPIKKLEYKIDNLKNIPPDSPTNETPKETAAPETMPTMAFAPRNLPVNTNGGFALNPKYTFDSFVVGKGSELAFAAAQAAVDAVVGDEQIEHARHQGFALGFVTLELQFFHRDVAQQNIVTLFVVGEVFGDDAAEIRKGDRRDLVAPVTALQDKLTWALPGVAVFNTGAAGGNCGLCAGPVPDGT